MPIKYFNFCDNIKQIQFARSMVNINSMGNIIRVPFSSTSFPSIFLPFFTMEIFLHRNLIKSTICDFNLLIFDWICIFSKFLCDCLSALLSLGHSKIVVDLTYESILMLLAIIVIVNRCCLLKSILLIFIINSPIMQIFD